MSNNTFYSELPRAVQHILEQGQTDSRPALARRSFLKMVGAGGLALGAFPHVLMAQEGKGAAAAASALKPGQQPLHSCTLPPAAR